MPPGGIMEQLQMGEDGVPDGYAAHGISTAADIDYTRARYIKG
jgi:hypothetical protein